MNSSSPENNQSMKMQIIPAFSGKGEYFGGKHLRRKSQCRNGVAMVMDLEGS